MNEEFVSNAYSFLKSKGYNQDIESFKKNIASSDEFVSKSYEILSSNGYSGDVDIFKSMVGFSSSEESKSEESESFTNGSVEQQEQPTEPLKESGVSVENKEGSKVSDKIENPTTPTPLISEDLESQIPTKNLESLRFDPIKIKVKFDLKGAKDKLGFQREDLNTSIEEFKQFNQKLEDVGEIISSKKEEINKKINEDKSYAYSNEGVAEIAEYESIINQYNDEVKNRDLRLKNIRKKEESLLNYDSYLKFKESKIENGEYIEPDYFDSGIMKEALLAMKVTNPVLAEVVDDMGRSIAQGLAMSKTHDDALFMYFGGDVSDKQIEKYIKDVEYAESFPVSGEMVDYQKSVNEENGSVWGIVKGIAKNPGIVPQLMVNSYSQMLSPEALTLGATAGVAASATGVGATIAVPAAMSVASGVTAGAAMFTQLLKEEVGEEDFNKDNVRAVLDNDEAMSRIRRKVAAYSSSMILIETIGGKIATDVGAKIYKSGVSSLQSKGMAIAASSSIESASGMLGEAGALASSGQELDASEIALEGVSPIAKGPIDVLTGVMSENNKIQESKSRFKKKFDEFVVGEISRGTPIYRVNEVIVNKEVVTDLINNGTAEELSAAQIEIYNDKDLNNESARNKINELSKKEKIKEALDVDISDESVNEIYNLQEELDKLDGNTTEVAKAKSSELKAKIKETVEAGKLDAQKPITESDSKTVEELRSEEQSEMLREIPNSEESLTNGKVDRDKLPTDEGKAKFDEIYNKYDKLISPLLDDSSMDVKEEVILSDGELSTESVYNKKVDENNKDFIKGSNEFKDKAANYDEGVNDVNFVKENTLEEEVDVADIVPTQDKLFEKSLNNKSTDNPILIKVGDKYYVEDGHHRIADKIISGGGKINATVYDSATVSDVEKSNDTKVDEESQKSNEAEIGINKLRNQFKLKPKVKDSKVVKEASKVKTDKEVKVEEESINSTDTTAPKIELKGDKKQKPRKTKKKPLKKEKVNKVDKATKNSSISKPVTKITSNYGANHAKSLSGVAYEVLEGIGIIQAFNIYGRPIYVAYKGGSRARVGIDSYTGDLFSDIELKKLKDLKEKLERAEVENQESVESPFKKQGRVASTDSVPESIKGFVRDVTQRLGVSKKIFIITDSDINEFQFKKHGLYGSLAPVRSASLSSNNDLEFGSKRYMSDADAYYIYYDTNLSDLQAFTVVSHELGHVVEQSIFDGQPKEVKDSIMKEYREWYSNLSGKTVSEVINETRDITIQELFAGNTSQFNPNSHRYISSFSEYFADNVSKWMRTSDKPKSIVDKMFKDISDQFKKIFNYLKNTKNYSKSIFEWLDSIYETDISGKNPENEMLSKMSSSDNIPSIKDVLEFSKDNNIDDADVRSYLLELGYTKNEADSAIKKKNKKASQSVYSETRGMSEREYFTQGFEEVYSSLRNKISEIKNKHKDEVKNLKNDSKEKKLAERELIAELSLSIEAILPKSGSVSRSVAIQLSKANTVAKVEAVVNRLERLATKNYENQLKAIKDKASGDILNNLLNKKNWIGKKEEGKPRKKKLTDKVISILKEMASVYNEDKLDSMSADEIVALQKEINELISESKLEVKLIDSAKKKVRKAFSGRITEMIARKNNKKKPLNSREDAVSLLKSGSVVIIDGVTFNSLKDFELAYPEGTKISGESVYIPSQPGLSMSGIKSRLLGRFSKILDLQGLLETFTQSSEDKSLIYEQILKPSSDKFYGKDNDIQKLDKARRKLVSETLNKGKGLVGAISKVARLYEKSGISFINKSGEKSLEITNDNAIYLYNAFKQLDGVEKFISSGYSLKEVSTIIDYINSSQDLKAYADGLNSIYSEYLPSINESLVSNGFESIAEATTKSKEDLAKKNGEEFANDYYEILSKIYGGEQNIPAIERYSPISVSSKQIDSMQNTNIFDSKAFNISAFAPNVFERSKGGTLNIRSSTSVFNSYSNSMANMVHSLDLLKKFQSFMTTENRRLIVDNYGQQFYQSIENSMNDIIYGKAKSTMSDAESYSSMKQWLNNANASVMFLNFKSAATQLLSATNFALESDISFSDYMNNAFNYSSKEMVTARKELSEALAIEYRGDRNTSSIEIDALRNSEFGDKDVTQNVSHLISSALSKGYYFTSKADVFAIKLGGAPYYMAKRNEFYAENIASGMEKTKAYEDAKDRALKKTYEVANKTQQSSNLDRVSAEQKDPLSRLVLTFGTVSMQYNREMISAARDIRNGRGDLSNNLAKIVYYGTIQNVIFQTISAAMGAIGGEDDEVKGATIINRSIDSLLKGFGVYGVAASAAKNGLYDFYSYVKRKQNENGELSNAAKKALEELANINFDKKTYKEPKEVILNTVSSISPAIGGKIKQSVGLFYQAGNGEYTKTILNSINFASNVPADRLLDLTDAFNEDLSGFHRLARITNVMKNYEVEKNLQKEEKSKTSGRETSARKASSGRDTSGRKVSSGRNTQ